MKFSESGLPDNTIIEEAFNYSLAFTKALHTEIMGAFTQQIDGFHLQNLQALEAAREEQGLSDEDYEQEKAELENMRSEQLKIGPQVVAEELENIFRTNCIGPALEIQNHSDKATPELVAAAMMINCVRSPVDHRQVAEKFGAGVSGVVAEVLHIDAYPATRDTALAAAGSDSKRAYLALLTSNLTRMAEQAEMMAQMPMEQQAAFPPGHEEALFSTVSLVWGNDKKLDQHLVDIFNRATLVMDSPFKIEINAQGTPELIQGVVGLPMTRNPRPRGPKGPTIGDDAF
jgi:hypothetical protein